MKDNLIKKILDIFLGCPFLTEDLGTVNHDGRQPSPKDNEIRKSNFMAD